MVLETALYERLGLRFDASGDDIRRSYRQAALRYHPDRNPDDPSAAETFKACLEAYEILSDPSRRATYDAQGIQGVRLNGAARAPPPTAAYQPPPDSSTIFEEFEQEQQQRRQRRQQQWQRNHDAFSNRFNQPFSDPFFSSFFQQGFAGSRFHNHDDFLGTNNFNARFHSGFNDNIFDDSFHSRVHNGLHHNYYDMPEADEPPAAASEQPGDTSSEQQRQFREQQAEQLRVAEQLRAAQLAREAQEQMQANVPGNGPQIHRTTWSFQMSSSTSGDGTYTTEYHSWNNLGGHRSGVHHGIINNGGVALSNGNGNSDGNSNDNTNVNNVSVPNGNVFASFGFGPSLFFSTGNGRQ